MSIHLTASILIGLILGYLDIYWVKEIAQWTSDIFVNFMKLISLPILFLSITSAISQFDHIETFKQMMKKTLKYTTITTLIAATIAMFSYMIIQPAQLLITNTQQINLTQNYLGNFKKIIPSNFFQMFIEGNVIGIVLVAMGVGVASLHLKKEYKKSMSQGLSSAFQVFMLLAQYFIRALPTFLWAFIVLFMHDLKSTSYQTSIIYYFLAILLANSAQAIIVLPILLKIKGFPVIKTLKGAWPALTTAFFSKSSNASIPITIDNITKNLGIDKKIASFTIPMCATVNMNACAAFIYITVIFISQSYGMHFDLWHYFLWIFLASIAAFGNAGVPMGCYFMSTAFLVSMGVPTYMMGIILPFYTILDMFETAINVWSDICVTHCVQGKN